MILETLFSGVGTSIVDKLFDLARQKKDEKLRAMIQEELAKMALGSQSNSIMIVNIHIGDLVQQVHELSERGLSAQDVIAASRSHKLPELLSTSVQQKTADASKCYDMLLFYDPLAREGEFYTSDGRGGIHLLEQYAGWRKSWTQIIPGNFGGSKYTDLLFYDPVSGEGEFYTSDGRGGIHFLKRHAWQKIWTHIIPGNFEGSQYTGLLFYSSSTREGKFFSTDGQGNIRLLEHYVGWRKSWSKIVPMANA